MKLPRLFSIVVLASAPMGLAVVTACSTTTFVDVTHDAGSSATLPDPDASLDAKQSTDARADADANVPDGKCHPGSAAGLEKGSYAPPTGGYQGLCTDALIKAYVECRDGKMSSCAQVDADGGASCRSCIESSRSAPAWGPVVIAGGSFEFNEAGCGALNNSDTGTTGCGQGLADYTTCLQYTCRDQCAGPEYFDCATEARGNQCKSIVDNLKATCLEDVGPCFAQKADTPETLAMRLIKRFCGSP